MSGVHTCCRARELSNCVFYRQFCTRHDVAGVLYKILAPCQVRRQADEYLVTDLCWGLPQLVFSAFECIDGGRRQALHDMSTHEV